MQLSTALLSRQAGLALGVAALCVTAAVSDAMAKPKICPQFLAKYCVMNKADLIYTTWTNPCFASEQGLRILYAGACKFGPVNPPRTCTGSKCK
jgi:hypothetical protein